MRKDGTLAIVWTNRAEGGTAKYRVWFADYTARSTKGKKEIVGEDALRAYLIGEIKLRPGTVLSAFHDLKKVGSAEIFHTALTDNQLDNLGFA
jgi:hypothetical protein